VSHDDATLDPLAANAPIRGALRWAPCLVVRYHVDVGRLGEEAPVAGALVVGRDAPAFALPGVAAGRPLGDPCVSRRQLTVTWQGGSFGVRIEPGARRAVRVRLPDGTPAASTERVPAGTVVEIEGRVHLELAVRDAHRQAADRIGLVGESDAAWRLREEIRAVAGSPSPVLVVGETGAGKELVARAIAGSAPFVAVNCAALPRDLAEGELFGHRRGAFTGADRDRPGLFAAADGGVLFLDEIGELPLDLQPKLLRALAEGRVRRVGETEEIRVRVKVVAATNRDLEAAVRAGTFRADLWHRVSGLRIAVPPLRERRADVPALVGHFARRLRATHPGLERIAPVVDARPPAIAAEAIEALRAAEWPGNVRELAGAVERLAVLGTAPPRLEGPAPPPDLRAAMERHDHVKKRVAEALGISRNHLDKLLEREGIRSPGDLSRDEIAAALETHGDIVAAARALGVSERGLKLRLRALK
jgi:transcriptional regulator with GAF, ATPase, and Fis domain